MDRCVVCGGWPSWCSDLCRPCYEGAVAEQHITDVKQQVDEALVMLSDEDIEAEAARMGVPAGRGGLWGRRLTVPA